jgi:hypothetical protein
LRAYITRAQSKIALESLNEPPKRAS